MHVVVLIAGILDPKRPLSKPASGDWKDILHVPGTPFKLSPFDEAALETALKLRDKNPDTFITAIVTDAANDLSLMRSVAAYRIDQVLGLLPPPEEKGNPAWLAKHLGQMPELADRPADLTLIGREHGDLDDGMTPSYLAAAMQQPFIALTLTIQQQNDGQLLFYKSGSTHDETISAPIPVFASISNDKSNKIRHPLMKNVAMAKQLKFQIISGSGNGRQATILTEASPPSDSLRGTTPCHMLTGTIQEQVKALAAFLKQHHDVQEHP